MNEINKIISVCPKCYGIPSLKIIIQHPEQIEIECQCSYHETIKIELYLKVLYELNFIDTEEKYKYPKCKRHNRLCDCFCVTCSKHICKFCRKTSEHSFHQIRKILKHLYLERIIRNINEAYDFLNNYIPLLTNKSIELFSDFSNVIKKQSDYYIETNKNILHVLQILVNTYTLSNNNYIIIENLHQNCNISCLPFYNNKKNNKVTFDLIMAYFIDNSILKEPYKMKINLQNMVVKKTYTQKYMFTYGVYKLKDYSYMAQSYEDIVFQSLFKSTNINFKKNITSIDFLEDGRFVLSLECSIILFKKEGDEYIEEHTYPDPNPKQLIDVVIGLPENRIASCGNDCLIKIWRTIEPYDLLYIITNNIDIDQLYLLSNKKYFLSGSRDLQLKMWDCAFYQCECIFNPVSWSYPNAIFELSQFRLIIGGETMITILNYNSKQIEMQFRKDWIEKIYAFIELRDGTLLLNQVNNKVLIRYNDRKKVLSRIPIRLLDKSYYFLSIDNTSFLSGKNIYQVIEY